MNMEARMEQVTLSCPTAHDIYLAWDAPHPPPTDCGLIDWENPALASLLLANMQGIYNLPEKSCSDTALSY